MGRARAVSAPEAGTSAHCVDGKEECWLRNLRRVLLKPKTGLCTPHTVSQIEVFFLKDFRENVGQFKLRGPAWSKLVSDVALSFAQTAEIPSAKQQRYRRAKDITKLVLEPGMSFINELVALTLSFERYRQPWHLQELRSVLEVVQEDIRFQPMPAYWGLRKFADLGEVLTEEDAEKVVEDVQDLWKDVAVTVSAVLKLKVRSFRYPLPPKHATLLIALTEWRIADSGTYPGA